MKNKQEKILLLLFTVIYILSYSSMSIGGVGGYFHYNSIKYQAFKSILVLASAFIFTLFNKGNHTKLVKITTIVTILYTVICIIDNYFLKFSGTPLFYRLWWYSIIHLTNAGVYLGLLVNKTKQEHLNKFFIGYSPFYLFTFAVSFLRPFGDLATTNLKIGHGTLQFISYILKHPNDSEIWFNLLGNVLIFLPLPFIINAYFKKIKPYQQFMIGVIVPIFVEGYQFIFKCGDVDIDDIVLNILGFLIGFTILQIQIYIQNKRNNKKGLL